MDCRTLIKLLKEKYEEYERLKALLEGLDKKGDREC